MKWGYIKATNTFQNAIVQKTAITRWYRRFPSSHAATPASAVGQLH